MSIHYEYSKLLTKYDALLSHTENLWQTLNAVRLVLEAGQSINPESLVHIKSAIAESNPSKFVREERCSHSDAVQDPEPFVSPDPEMNIE